MSKKKITKRTNIKPFLKYINYNHDADTVPGARRAQCAVSCQRPADGLFGWTCGGKKVCEEPLRGEVHHPARRQVRQAIQGCAIPAQEAALLMLPGGSGCPDALENSGQDRL